MAVEPGPKDQPNFGREYTKNRIRGEVLELRDLIGFRGTYEYLLSLASEMCYPETLQNSINPRITKD